ncbi:MAG: hypothetical protein IKG01_14830 [Lachnospiraceae bacterium]|nr:hypothetical protein [Lachnospiraceae bacterium]
MLEAIIPSVLSAAATLLVCLINNHYQRIEVEKKHSETIALVEYRLDAIESKLEKHNQLVERTYELEKKAGIAEAEFKRVNHRLEDLEKGA